jgi:hypothetical protein
VLKESERPNVPPWRKVGLTSPHPVTVLGRAAVREIGSVRAGFPRHELLSPHDPTLPVMVF